MRQKPWAYKVAGHPCVLPGGHLPTSRIKTKIAASDNGAGRMLTTIGNGSACNSLRNSQGCRNSAILTSTTPGTGGSNVLKMWLFMPINL